MDFFHLFRTRKIPIIVIHDLRRYYPDIYVHLIDRGQQLVEEFIWSNIQRGVTNLRYRKSGEVEANIRPLIRLFKMALLDEDGQSAPMGSCIEFIGKLLIGYLTASDAGEDRMKHNVHAFG